MTDRITSDQLNAKMRAADLAQNGRRCAKTGLQKATNPFAPYANRTEADFARYLDLLKAAGDFVWWKYQPVTLHLGDRCTYTPDFVACGQDGLIRVFEVKGFFREDARVKWKVAIREFPWLSFVLVTRDGEHWHFEEKSK